MFSKDIFYIHLFEVKFTEDSQINNMSKIKKLTQKSPEKLLMIQIHAGTKNYKIWRKS